MEEQEITTEINNIGQEKEKEKEKGNDDKSFGHLGALLALCWLERYFSPLGIVACIVAATFLFSRRYYFISRVLGFLVIAGHVYWYFILPQISNPLNSIDRRKPHQQERSVNTTYWEEAAPQEEVITPRYNSDSNKWGYINKNGEMVIPFIYDYAGVFFGGHALVKLNNKYFYIDKSGKKVERN